LRTHLFSLLAYQGDDPAVIEQAGEIAGNYLANPESVDPTLARAALQVAARHGDAALFDKLQKEYETSSDPEKREGSLRLLVQFTDPSLLQRALEYSVSRKVRNQDSVFQFEIALKIPENRDAAWNFIKTHWDQVQAEFTTSMGAILVESSGSFCTVAARDEVKSFYSSHPVPASDVSLTHAIEHIDGCVELRRLQEPNLQKWLSAQGAH
jgi:aminopeptidase N